MRIEDFETEKATLLQDPEIRAAWLEYQRYHLNFSGREKHIIWLNLFCSDRDGYHCEKEGTISVQVTTGQEAANCNSFARSSMRVAKLGNVFV
jgi:hypothetical protein